MLLKELMEKYGEWSVDENDLLKIMDVPEPSNVWDIKDGNRYYYITDEGFTREDEWASRDKDYERRRLGNMFLTEEEVDYERGRLEIESLLLRYGGTRKFIEDGYIVSIQKPFLWIAEPCYVGEWCNQGAIYFKTEEQCKNAIEKIGEDKIIKFLFQS